MDEERKDGARLRREEQAFYSLQGQSFPRLIGDVVLHRAYVGIPPRRRGAIDRPEQEDDMLS